MTDAETHIYAFTSCHGDAYFGSFAELKDHAVIGPVSVVGPFVDERAAADHVGKWGRFNTRMLEIGETPVSIIVKSVPDEVRAPKADIGTQPRDVRFVPKADINDWPHRSLAEGNYDGLKSRRNRDVGWFHRRT